MVITNFNSLPHTEVDEGTPDERQEGRNFNSLPHTKVDQVPCLAHLLAFLFQLTTSHRGRL